MSVAAKNNFKFDRDIVIQSQKRFDEIPEELLGETPDVQKFEYQKHGDALTKLLMRQYNTSAEKARSVVDRYKEWPIGEKRSYIGTSQRLITHSLILSKEEIVGRLIGTQQKQSGEKTVDLTLYAQDNNQEILSQLLAVGIRESQKLGMEVLHIGFRNPVEEIKQFYSSYGLEFRTAAAYYTRNL